MPIHSDDVADGVGTARRVVFALDETVGAVFTDAVLVSDGEGGDPEATTDVEGADGVGSLLTVGAIEFEDVSGLAGEIEGDEDRAVCVALDGRPGPPARPVRGMNASTLIRTTAPRPAPSTAMSSILRL